MTVEVYIQGQRLDLYEDESINVTQVSKDIQDISKVFADFSQSFNVPASARNNEIFKHYYNANIDGGYDARIRKDANLVVGGLDFKRGKMRLDSVEVMNNEPTSYKITFFGSVIKIKDLIGEDKLFDLDWLDNFSHDYSGAQVQTGLTSGLDFTVDGVTYPDAIVYPLISYGRRYIYNDNSSDHTNTDEVVNIHYHTGHTGNEHGVDYKELKPAIKLFLIVKAIEKKYGFNFNSPFFNSPNFTEIYMNLNKEVQSLANGLKVVEDVIGTISSPPAEPPVRWRYRLQVTPKAGFINVDYKKRLYLNDQLIYEDNNFVSGFSQHEENTTIDLGSLNYNVRAEVVTEASFEFDATTRLKKQYLFSEDTLENNSYSDLVILIRTIITNQLKDIKVLDFLTSLFKMFNLVVVAREDDELYIQDLQSYYEEGRIFDVTKFIETKKEVVKRGKIFKEINFKFKESEQILANEFRQSNNDIYGNLDFKLSDANGQPLQDVDGEVLNVEVLFENPIFERIIDISDNSQTTLQYCLYTNREIKPISGAPFLFYARGVGTSTNPIGFLTETTYENLNVGVIIPIKSRQFNGGFNLNFNAEISEYAGSVLENTIYDEYYSDYIGDIFSPKRRPYEMEGILPSNLLNNLRLNDRLIIKGTRYIINKITSNLVDRRDQLELINDIFDAPLQSDSLNTSLFRNAFVIGAPTADFYSMTYIGLADKAINLVDLGDGTGWLKLEDTTTKSNVFEIVFSLNLNNTGSERTAGIQVVDGINDPTLIIIQDA
jgi:hypothetical protein